MKQKIKRKTDIKAIHVNHDPIIHSIKNLTGTIIEYLAISGIYGKR